MRSPRSDWVPSESLRWMTAPRRPRSAWLLVGSTPSVWVKVQRAGQDLRRLRANWRWYLVRVLLRAACSSSARSLVWSGADPASELAAVAVLLELLPGLEEAVRDREAGAAEFVLFAHSFAVGGEVSEEVGPAELAAVGVEVVVAAVAVGADDAVVAFAEDGLRLGGVAAGGNPNGAVVGVSAPGSQRRSPRVFQPVSSMLTTADCLSSCSSRVCGAASASPARSGDRVHASG